MRHGWLAMFVGLVIALALFGIGLIRLTRPIPNGHEIIALPAAYPSLLYLSIPGMGLMWFTIFFMPANWAAHTVVLQLLVGFGNVAFYSLAAYVVLRFAAMRRET